jgi:hypothetical protein
MGKLSKPDYAWIVDVGWEKTATFKQVDNITAKLAEVGVTLNVIKTVDYFDNALFDDSGFMKLPLYLKDGGIVKKLSTHCSGKWKQQVANKWLRSKGVDRCDTWVGISMDEKRRMKPSRLQWNQTRYPLIEMGIRREDCIDLIARMGWPKPEHTSCFICPNQNDFQWYALKERYRDSDWRRALEAERAIRERCPNMFLHRTCIPLEEIDFSMYGGAATVIGKECYGDCGPYEWGGRV